MRAPIEHFKCRRHRHWLLAAATGGLVATWSSSALAVTVTFPSVKDNTLYEDETGSLSNGAGDGMFARKNGLGQIRRAVVAFNVSTPPPNAFVTSASLHLNCTQ